MHPHSGLQEGCWCGPQEGTLEGASGLQILGQTQRGLLPLGSVQLLWEAVAVLTPET